MNKIGIALLLGAVFAVGCGDKEGGAGSGSAKASSAPKDSAKPSGGSSASTSGGGSTDDYVKAYCDCKNETKCLTDVSMKYGEALAKTPLNADQSKKIADCTMAAGMPSGMPSAK